MTSNIWTLITIIILPNGELEGNNLTYTFENKHKCESYLKASYQSNLKNKLQVEMKFNSSRNMYTIAIKNKKKYYSTCRMSIAWK